MRSAAARRDDRKRRAAGPVSATASTWGSGPTPLGARGPDARRRGIQRSAASDAGPSAAGGLETADAEVVALWVAHPDPQRAGLLQRLRVDALGAERDKAADLGLDVEGVHVEVHAVLAGTC